MEPPSPYSISILNDSGRRIPVDGLERVARIALGDLHLPSGDLSIRLTTSDEIRALNRDYRKIDSATDVLTFPAADLPIQGLERPHGDIAISVERAETQAKARKIPTIDELGHLLVHGILHLAGWDDETEADREEMVEQMERIAVICGLAPAPDWHTMEEVTVTP